MSVPTSIVPPSIAVIRDPAILTTPKPVLASPGSIPMTILIRDGFSLGASDAFPGRERPAYASAFSRTSSGMSKLA